MSEKDFKEWLESIEVVDEDGIVIPAELKEDTSEDPDGDREIEKSA